MYNTASDLMFNTTSNIDQVSSLPELEIIGDEKGIEMLRGVLTKTYYQLLKPEQVSRVCTSLIYREDDVNQVIAKIRQNPDQKMIIITSVRSYNLGKIAYSECKRLGATDNVILCGEVDTVESDLRLALESLKQQLCSDSGYKAIFEKLREVFPEVTDAVDETKLAVQSSVFPLEATIEEIAEAKKLLDIYDTKGLHKLAEEFGLEFLTKEGEKHHLLDNMMREVLIRNKNGAMFQLIDRLADEFICDPYWDFSQWCHSLCHNFEKYKQLEGKFFPRGSLLNRTENLSACAKLVNETVRRALIFKEAGNNRPGNLSRILIPLINFNIDQLNPEKLDEEFPLKPSALINPQTSNSFLEFFNQNISDSSIENKIIADFISAKTPRAYLISLISAGLNSPFQNLPPTKLITLFKALEKDIPSIQIESILAILLRLPNDQASLGILENKLSSAETAKEVVDAVFVDVDDTLITRQGRLNTTLLQIIIELKQFGRKIIIFSGGNPICQTERLALMGVNSDLLPVQSKADYQGKILDTLIDDTSPELQGFKAIHTLNTYSQCCNYILSIRR